MTQTERRYRAWLLREWRCCGERWQLLLSARYPWRYGWRPVCSTCGKIHC
jgi:hypothetical protein